MVKMYRILEMKRHLFFNEPKEKINMAESWNGEMRNASTGL